MMRFILALTTFFCVAAACGPAYPQAGFDRRGGDYFNFPVANGDPATCAARCERETLCRAWSFAYPTTTRPSATCWLKNEIKPRSENACCVSGVRGTGVVEPVTTAVEFAIDRVGGDYRNFEVQPDVNGKICAEACQADTHCRAWTYSRPGYTGNAARCFLKDRVKPPRRKPCCISGVVR